MRIITKRHLVEFTEKHPTSKEGILRWFEIALNAKWNNFNEIKRDFNTVDAVGDELFVFNINGNKYRIIVRIFFNIKRIYIRFIGTHKQYDKINIADL